MLGRLINLIVKKEALGFVQQKNYNPTNTLVLIKLSLIPTTMPKRKESNQEETVAKKPKTRKKVPLEVREDSSSSDDEVAPKRKATTSKNKTVEKKEKPTTVNKTSTTFDGIDFGCSKKNRLGKEFNLKISNWNVDGLRAWLKKGGLDFITHEEPDVLCVQETKCSESKIPPEIKDLENYKMYWHCSNKDGYAGVGLFTKKEPISIQYGIGDEEQDNEGRCITAEYENYYVVSVYVPNAGRGLVTLPKRLEWNKVFKHFIKELDLKKPVIICGDMNVAHNEIDLTNPKTNTKNAGFTKEEREGMTEFLEDGYVDTFRKLYPDKTGSYTFWSYMRNARSKNIGWRLDYFIVSERLSDNVCDNVIRSEVFGSDHCPLTLFLHI
ncbi:hypothetical protein FQR65_LT14271 [Abscondita terminalis]|nr:hypothetical protein FQR65_LT14271 [Abscondita terminalis]